VNSTCRPSGRCTSGNSTAAWTTSWNCTVSAWKDSVKTGSTCQSTEQEKADCMKSDSRLLEDNACRVRFWTIGWVSGSKPAGTIRLLREGNMLCDITLIKQRHPSGAFAG